MLHCIVSRTVNVDQQLNHNNSLYSGQSVVIHRHTSTVELHGQGAVPLANVVSNQRLQLELVSLHCGQVHIHAHSPHQARHRLQGGQQAAFSTTKVNHLKTVHTYNSTAINTALYIHKRPKGLAAQLKLVLFQVMNSYLLYFALK